MWDVEQILLQWQRPIRIICQNLQRVWFLVIVIKSIMIKAQIPYKWSFMMENNIAWLGTLIQI